MALGNLLFMFSVCWPTFTGQVDLQVSVAIECVVFELLWVLMVWSHSYTMCNEPGYIPLNYRYDSDKVPDQFK